MERDNRRSISEDTLALRFVQDHIRYMGFEEGLGEYKPREPALVFQRRFGDCKDKAFLLHALLKLMDIDSTPALVHSRIGKRIHEGLPSPSAFDHVILQITLGDKMYWVDGTISLQGGSLQDNYIPHYHHALLISDKTTDLTPLPAYTPLKPTELESSYVISSPEFAEMKYTNTFYGPNAEYMRRLIERRGLEKLSEEWVDDIQKKFRGATALSSPVVQDDRERNILTLQESYKIYTKELKDERVLRPCSFIIEDYLDNYVNLERKTPYSLNYPLWVKERIHIENPRSSWLEESEHTEIKHQTLNFSYDYKSKNHAIDFEYELKHVDDHIPVDLIKGYWNMINKIEERAPGNIKIDLSPVVPEYIYTFLNPIGLILIPWFLYSCLLHRQKRKKGYLF